MPPMLMKHDTDPADAIRATIGNLDAIDLFQNQVLIGIYIRPAKTAGGIILADQTRDEDLYQGKVGLVLKKGPIAFVDDDRVSFHGKTAEVGDWIVFRPSDGWALSVNKVACRVLQDVHVRAKVTSPDVIW